MPESFLFHLFNSGMQPNEPFYLGFFKLGAVPWSLRVKCLCFWRVDLLIYFDEISVTDAIPQMHKRYSSLPVLCARIEPFCWLGRYNDRPTRAANPLIHARPCFILWRTVASRND
jgi:hypothetical protein